MDFSTDLLVQNPLASALFGLGAIGAAWRAWRMTNSGDAVTRANDRAVVLAIENWMKVADRERVDKLEAMARADKFLADYNTAMAQVNQMQGKLSVMMETIAAQSTELGELREQLRRLREQVDAG
jgi:hypothetical protein